MMLPVFALPCLFLALKKVTALLLLVHILIHNCTSGVNITIKQSRKWVFFCLFVCFFLCMNAVFLHRTLSHCK